MHTKPTVTPRQRNSTAPEHDPCFHVEMSGGRSLALRLEPGKRDVPLYRLSVWSDTGLQAGGFGGTERQIIELLMALQKLAAVVDEGGFPHV